MATSKKVVETTTLDEDVTKPSVTAPGDGPADTTDPTEIATTVGGQPGPEALKVGTVNAAVPVEFPPGNPPAPDSAEGEQRFEEYDAVKPDGSVVRVKRNIDTGESSIVTK